jgi:dTDP-4-amino-4,6-dideoxygalactose transaminase
VSERVDPETVPPHASSLSESASVEAALVAPPAPAAGLTNGAAGSAAHPARSGPEAQTDSVRRTRGPDPIPLMDPRRVYAEWGPQAERKMIDILRSHTYVKGPSVSGFESEFAADTGVRHAVAVDSCTDALYLVLRSVLDQRPPEAREVILPTFTFVATAGAVVNAGGTPIFADVDPATYNIDPASVSALLSERTAAVIPVHIFGAPADLPGIREAIAPFRSNGDPRGRGEVFVLEDAAQAIHATLHGVRAGALADAGTFSFYPSKNLAAAGDGGIVTTDDDALADHVRALRDHGQTRKLYDHSHVGTNSRMDEMQAAILRLKLPHIARWTADRAAIAARYDEAFAGSPVQTQALLPGSTSAWHLYTVRLAGRDAVRRALTDAGIGCGVYYPQPLHQQSCFAQAQPGPCPQADALSASVLSLPCFPGLRSAEQERVIEIVLRALKA